MSGAAAAVTKVAQANIVISIVGMVSELVRLGAKAVNTHIDNTRDAKEAINRRPEVARLYATFTFQLGLNEVPLQTGEHPLQGAGGDLPDIRVWDETLTFLGDEANKDKTLQTGSIIDVEVHLSKPHQPTYALFKGKSDPICVTYIGTRWPNGAEWNWFGNWAYHCDRRWHVCPDPNKIIDIIANICSTRHYSGIEIDGRRDLKCAWLGKCYTPAIQVHFPEFDATGPSQHLTDTIGYFCNQTQALYFHEDPDPQVLVVSKESKFLNPPVAGTEAPIKQAQGNRLIIDTSKDRGWERSAIELCSSPFSEGPDFVSLREQMYCDMHEKKLWKLCTRREKLNGDKTPVVSKACWDMELKRLKGKLEGIGPRNVDDHPYKTYDHIYYWK